LKPIIAKQPDVPPLTAEQMKRLTEITFLSESKPIASDVIFVFSGTHPGHWEKTIEAYEKGLGKTIIVTGGVSPTGRKHPNWENEMTPEAHVIIEKLLEAGIPKSAIVYEDKSSNTLENVLFAKEVFDFNDVKSVLFICKAHTAGRQYRTLANYLRKDIAFHPYGFDTVYEGVAVSHNNWMHSPIGRARVYGEYKRILFYGFRGDILPLEKENEI
jgi:uncharacterized SAM-binding protein YcdF (DUF218 family)